MTESIIVEIMQQTLRTTMLLAAPPLISLVVVGLLTQIVQTVTQLKDQSLTFIPKMAVTGGLMLILLPWYITEIKAYFQLIFNYMGITTQ
ncbi:MAG: flagellar biosynthetic protein FliQ [Lentisphaerales bacterium]|nr:flagellar biosynthetic protein FliQ [Lentisphaerales bacterium]